MPPAEEGLCSHGAYLLVGEDGQYPRNRAQSCLRTLMSALEDARQAAVAEGEDSVVVLWDSGEVGREQSSFLGWLGEAFLRK